MITIHSITELQTREDFLMERIDRNAKIFGHHTKVLPAIQADMMKDVLRSEVHGQ